MTGTLACCHASMTVIPGDDCRLLALLMNCDQARGYHLGQNLTLSLSAQPVPRQLHVGQREGLALCLPGLVQQQYPDHSLRRLGGLGDGGRQGQGKLNEWVGSAPLRGRARLDGYNLDALPLPDHVVHATACLGTALTTSRARMMVSHIFLATGRLS